MSGQYPGGWITRSPPTPDGSTARGLWTLSQQATYRKQGLWPTPSGAPTIGTAAVSGNLAISVTFTPPADTGSSAITQYVATSSPGGLTGTGASSPVIVSGLTEGTAYTFTVRAVNGSGSGPASEASNSVTAASGGQQAYTVAGTYSWVVPAGVTSISVVTVGAGAGGGGYNSYSAGGGALGYKNNISVTPGQSYSVVVGAGGVAGSSYGTGNPGNNSTFSLSGTGIVGAEGGKTPTSGLTYANPLFGSSGGRGVASAASSWSYGGGGAGGYSGDGGVGSDTTPTAGSGGGGGGGYGSTASGSSSVASGGGGVGILGQGANGAAGYESGTTRFGGGGGSGGTNGGPGSSASSTTITNTGGSYGGGGGGVWHSPTFTGGRTGGVGAVRIIWPGTTRSFPSTATGDF